MITKEQATSDAREFHYDPEGCGDMCKAKGSNLYRRNGKTQTWKTRPDEFRIPVKFGMYGYFQITPGVAHAFHLASECPASS